MAPYTRPMKKFRSAPFVLGFISLTVLFSRLPRLAWSAEPPAPRISRITIDGSSIFDLNRQITLRHFPYTWINVLHIQTKEQIIRQELLLKEGDPVDEFLIHETERNLRALSFIRSAQIEQLPQTDGTVALMVHVGDSWTTEPQINTSGINKIDTVEVGFKEKNFLGYGKSVGVFYQKGVDSIQREYRYFDPRFLGSRWQLTGNYISRTGGLEKFAEINRPFFSADTRFSARTSYNQIVQPVDVFQNNVKVSQFEQTKDINESYIGTKVGGGRSWVAHEGIRYKYESQHFAATDKTNGAIPIPEKFKTLFSDLDISRTRFIVLTRVEKMTRVEDINLGPQFSLSPGYSPKQFTGTRDSSEFESTYGQSFLINQMHLATTRFEMKGRNIFTQPENERYLASAQYYDRRYHFQTMTAKTRLEWGQHLDSDNQITLGGNNGLRAFAVNDFSGNKSFLFNAEDRIFIVDEAFELFAIGAAVFYDAGSVWSEGQTMCLSDIHSDVGAGLRLGLTRSSSEVIVRLDFSYRLQRSPANSDKFIITFGTSQAF